MNDKTENLRMVLKDTMKETLRKPVSEGVHKYVGELAVEAQKVVDELTNARPAAAAKTGTFACYGQYSASDKYRQGSERFRCSGTTRRVPAN